jgi:hypothetical protein
MEVNFIIGVLGAPCLKYLLLLLAYVLVLFIAGICLLTLIMCFMNCPICTIISIVIGLITHNFYICILVYILSVYILTKIIKPTTLDLNNDTDPELALP